MQGPPTHYELLGVASNATADDIRDAYRALCKTHHPDRNPDDTSASDTMADINAAYEVLCDPERRREYDAWLAEQGDETVKALPHPQAHPQKRKPVRPRDEDGITDEERAAAREFITRFWHVSVAVIVFVGWIIFTYVECKAEHGWGFSCGHRYYWH